MDHRPARPPVTKLYPPSTDAALLQRPELLAALDGLEARKLAVVVAPTGAGKSTLLAQGFHGLGARGWDVAWLSLDPFDNEPRAFLRNLVAALLRARPHLEAALADLVAANADVRLTDAMNGIIAVCASPPAGGRPLALFLDDCQSVDNADVLAAIGYLIQYSDAGTRFVIASQRRLPFGVTRLRARGAVIEIGFDELRLGASEVRDYLRQVQRLTLPDARIAALADRTEGWICGLQLASIALRQRGDEAADNDGANGTAGGDDARPRFPDRFADGLLDEILASQSPETRAFLLDTAPLDAFCAPLCDALTGRDDAVDQIEMLEQSGLFIVRLDREHIWFRYHHLFQEYLRRQKAAQGQPALRRLFRRASAWYADNRMPAEAFRAALAAEDATAAAGILERWGERLLREGDFRALDDGLRALGRPVVRASVRLNVFDAWTQLYLGDALTASDALDAAARLVAAGGPDHDAARRRLVDEIRLVRAMCGVTRHDLVNAEAVDSDLATAFPAEDGLRRAWAQVVLGYAARAQGRQVIARRHFVEAIRIADGDNDLVVSLMARYNRAIGDQLIARPDLALQGLRQWLDEPGNRRWLRTGSSAFLLSAAGIAHSDRLEFAAAEKALDASIELLSQTRTFAFLDIARVLRARVWSHTGRGEQALAELDEIATALRERAPDRVWVRVAVARARTLIEAGGGDAAVAAALAEAEQVLIASGQLPVHRPPADRMPDDLLTENAAQFELACCHRLARTGDDRGLLARAGRMVALEARAGRVRHQIELLALLAVAVLRSGARRDAARHLAAAIRLAQPGGAWLPLVAAGPALLSIPLGEESDGSVLDEGRRVAFQGIKAETAGDGDAGLGQHGLHRRELQILTLVGQGLRNREIGERLHIGEETVKWYLKRAYEALGVRNRAHALARARELGLV